MIVLGLEEFASKRRSAQARIEDALRAGVERAIDGKVNTGGYNDLLSAVSDQWKIVYADESGSRAPAIPATFRDQLHQALRKTDRGQVTEATVDRITVWLATAILSNATLTASGDDPEELFMEWVDMNDNAVRETHREAAGQQRPIGEKFSVGGKKMAYPGDPSVPIELWINCRCTLRPVLASEALVAAATKSLTVIVGIPAEDSPVHSIGEEQKHVTLAFLGEFDGDVEALREDVARVAAELPGPFPAAVSGTASLGPDKAKVWLIESDQIADARNSLFEFSETIAAAVDAADTHPHFVPHTTITYDADMPAEATDVTEILFDRLAVWHREEQYEYTLGEPMSENAPEVEKTEEPETEAPTTPDAGQVPWHGVLAPEGVASGDGRKFALGSLRVRPLPLPLTWQKTSADGHSGSVTVARIDRIERVDNEMRASGMMLATAEADEVIGLLADFGRFGVSVDADDASMEMDDDAEEVVFTDARIASASIVAIPAFAEAWVSLGAAPAEFFPEAAEPVAEDDTVVDDAEAASLVAADVAPGVTEDGPGWLTNPVDTDRLRDYWVRGEGAAKIGWGTDGDFNRCRVNLAEYVKPQYLNGYCANRHFDALGTWPGRNAHASEGLVDTEPAEALGLVAAGGYCAPSEWFAMPEPNEPTPLTITEEGQVYGHIAAWNTCHSSWADKCVVAPRSPSNYSHFLLGGVLTDKGTVATGSLTIGGGHAGPNLSMRAAMSHYDNSTAVFADVTVMDGEHGIWACGWVRPGTSDEMIVAARASKLSGDWRKSPKGLDMIAALAVNVPGFRIPRVAAGIVATEQMSLVAAGVVASESKGNGEIDLKALAAAVADEIESRTQRKAKMAALAARVKEQ